MSVRDWLMQGSPKVLGAALASSVIAGMALGMYLQLPAYLSEPILRSEPQMILQEDPGRQKWNQVVASLGGLGATFVIPSYLYSEPQPAVFETEGDREFRKVMAEAESLIAATEARVVDREWYRRQEAERERRDWRLRRIDERSYDYAAAPADSYGYGPPPNYGPPLRYEERPRYEELARYESPTDPQGEMIDDRLDEPVPPPPPRPSFGY